MFCFLKHKASRSIAPFFVAIIFIGAIAPTTARCAEPSYTPEEVLQYARSLYDRGEYQLSLLEYQRFLDKFPNHAALIDAKEGKAECLFQLGRYDSALQTYIEVAKALGITERGWMMTLKIARCYQATGQNDVALEIYRRGARQGKWPAVAQRSQFELGWYELMQGQWTGAASQFSAVSDNAEYGSMATYLARQAPEGANLPHKDPVLAGVLSGVLPGAGQLYTNQPKDAALAFVLNGLFIAGSVEAFSEELYVIGGILVLIESAWYGGNIYNAVNHAHRYNRNQRESFLLDLWNGSGMSVGLPKEDSQWYRVTINFRF